MRTPPDSLACLVATSAVDFRICDHVATAPTVRPRRFAHKTGVVVHLNIRDNEVGVWLGDYGSDGHRSVTWFRPSEVVAADTATTARRAPVPPSSAALSTDLAKQALTDSEVVS